MAEPRIDIRHVLERAIELHQKGSLDDAEILYNEVLSQEPNEPNAWNLLGAIAWTRNDLASAEKYIKKAIKIHSKAPAYYNNLGGVLSKKGDLPGAIDAYERSLRLAPQDESARKELSQIFHRQGLASAGQKKWDEAIRAYYRVLDFFPESVATLNNLATILQHRNDRPKAEVLYERALKISPDNLMLRYNRSICYLTDGKLIEGWADFEASKDAWYSLQDNRANLPWLSLPLWDGKSDLKDQTILVWGDQGIGDEIIYGSLINELIERGAKVTIETTDRLVPIYKRSFPSAIIYARENPPLLGANFNWHAPGLWLARCLRPTWDTFKGQAAFLKSDREQTERLRKRYEAFGKKRILGLSWYTKSEAWGLQRSIQLPDLLSELPLKDTLIVDLQYGNTADAWAQAKKMFPDLTVIRDVEVDQLKDMDSYTSQVAACDAVVTICNTTSHVAGALGIKSAVLMPEEGLTWYWFADREECPWYKSLMLIRPKKSHRFEAIVSMIETIGA